MSKSLYHDSPAQGLTQLRPQPGTHGPEWVYATDDPAVAALFLGRTGGDLTCALGLVGDRLYLRERFAGAFDLRYGQGPGSLYVLPARDFTPGRTSWCRDWVSEHAVTPRRERRVSHPWTHLLGLAAAGRLNLLHYPEGITDPDTEETDLVQAAVRKYRHRGAETLDLIKVHHPRLFDRVLEAVSIHQESVDA